MRCLSFEKSTEESAGGEVDSEPLFRFEVGHLAEFSAENDQKNRIYSQGQY